MTVIGLEPSNPMILVNPNWDVSLMAGDNYTSPENMQLQRISQPPDYTVVIKAMFDLQDLKELTLYFV